jgi:phosphoribosylaminoimidazolecarboxamide formyltransferase/IMP cyclohydrolase
MMNGRVKTLHPKVHGALLGLRDNPEHVDAMAKHDIEPIDMVVVNLYPFEATVAKEGCSLEDAIENIDIGGPTMLRSAAKNNRFVTVLVDPSDYAMVIAEMKQSSGAVSTETNFRLAVKVYQHTAAYDGAISNWLGQRTAEEHAEFAPTLTLQFQKARGCVTVKIPIRRQLFMWKRILLKHRLQQHGSCRGKRFPTIILVTLMQRWSVLNSFLKLLPV